MIHHVFANRSNIGDWLAAIGIQRAPGMPAVSEHLCDGPFVPDTLAALGRAGDGDLVVIGGGGLLMDYFAPLWEGMTEIVRRVPVCTWGIGLCDLKKEHTRPPDDLLREVLGAVRVCAVRDGLTQGYLRGLGVDAAIVPCPSLCVVEPPPVRGHGILHVDNYTTVGADAYEAMTSFTREFAERTSRPCRSRNNRIEPGDRGAMAAVLSSYARSDIVVSSALHGCIIAVAMGLPVIAVSGDRKIEEFMAAAGLGAWVLDADEVDGLPAMLSALGTQKTAPGFRSRAVARNRELAARVLAPGSGAVASAVKPIAIVTGMIASYPVGGVAWDYGQYALGLEQLGYDVYYLEDTGWQTYDPVRGEYGEDSARGVAFLAQSLRDLSPTLGERWHFRSMAGTTHGMPPARLREVIGQTALFLNVSGGTLLRDEYMAIPCKVLIDSDPGWNHFVNYPRWDASPGWQDSHGYRAHDVFFTYAERMGYGDCVLPDLGIRWHATRPPVIMSCWNGRGAGRAWTTVMTWNNFREPITYRGRGYGTKEMEFPKVEAVPARLAGVDFELAAGGSGAPLERWREHGWRVVDSHAVSRTLDAYREYIEQSRGEISVAKNVYTATRSGWFSCRSVCYLAAGRPAVVQDTGFAQRIPTGEGLHAFADEDSAVAALERVEADYPRHSRAAVEVAREHFAHDRVLGDLLLKAGLR